MLAVKGPFFFLARKVSFAETFFVGKKVFKFRRSASALLAYFFFKVGAQTTLSYRFSEIQAK